MNEKTIKPSPTAKLLGVTFDQELRWKEHVQQAIKRATKVTIYGKIRVFPGLQDVSHYERNI